MDLKFPTKDEVLLLHEQAIEVFGGTHGLREGGCVGIGVDGH